METLFRRTGDADFPDKLKCLVNGPPKSGKTSFLGTVPNIVIADTEPNANNLATLAHLRVPYVSVRDADQLRNLLLVLHDDNLRAQAARSVELPAIEAVAVDTMDTMQQLLKHQRMTEQRQTQMKREDWAWLKEELAAIIASFTSLPLHVFFTCHIKTQELGHDDDVRTVVQPDLQGGIADEIAGMVGYSLLCFRREEVAPDGSKFTKYWMRTEGDETYPFLGNRAAGRLPAIIEPDFHTIYTTAMSGRASGPPAPSGPEVIQAVGLTTASQDLHARSAPQAAPSAPQPVQAPQAVPESPAAVPTRAPGAATQGGTPSQPPAPAGDSDEPLSAAALMHVKKVYDACALKFPESLVRDNLSLGQARKVVVYWQAVQKDAMEGKLTAERTIVDEMVDHLGALLLLDPEDRHLYDELLARDGARPAGGQATPAQAPSTPVASSPEPAAPEVDPGGTIDQVLAWVGGDGERAQRAYDAEIGKVKPRQTLLNQLLALGARHRSPPTAGIAAPVAEPVTAYTAMEQAAQVVSEQLGGVEVAPSANGADVCGECGRPVDDEDIAALAQTRYGKPLCVADYIEASRKPQAVG